MGWIASRLPTGLPPTTIGWSSGAGSWLKARSRPSSRISARRLSLDLYLKYRDTAAIDAEIARYKRLSAPMASRFREFFSVGAKPFYAFTAGVAVNIVLGYLLSTQVFVGFWTRFGQ